jgi:hypothetical protein
MRIAAITRHGLLGMAVSVGLLWGCLISEHLILHHAYLEQSRALQEIQRLRGFDRPVGAPAPGIAHRTRSRLG